MIELFFSFKIIIRITFRVNVKSNEIGDLNHWGPETGRNVGRKYKKIKHTEVQTLSGVQATTYCRIRKNSGGDTGRAKRYKKVMAGVFRKAVTSPGKLGTLSEEDIYYMRFLDAETGKELDE